MSAANVIKPLTETQEQCYRLFVEAKLYGYVDTKSLDRDSAIADVTALRDVYTNLISTEGKSLKMDVADWDIDVTGTASPKNGEMEEERLMTYQKVQAAGLPFRANLPQYIMDELQSEQDKLYFAAEAHPDTHFYETRLNGFERALLILGIHLPYPENKDKAVASNPLMNLKRKD
ncbi:hypothetical protein OYT88_02295 [Sporolactobacillus sp. CQH2019]|uniref:hypothetical protein n=1 Tax=Sporolactobacillus sp. CQH2019 TaxID=3023512 RepID=UPI0023688C01|nr:hypothetical protein [Sporolactobacillus sp. CQH2019]MDD9147380.1 hypothetical protein [Sporolactobacillus sp. CQH2019]